MNGYWMMNDHFMVWYRREMNILTGTKQVCAWFLLWLFFWTYFKLVFRALFAKCLKGVETACLEPQRHCRPILLVKGMAKSNHQLLNRERSVVHRKCAFSRPRLKRVLGLRRACIVLQDSWSCGNARRNHPEFHQNSCWKVLNSHPQSGYFLVLQHRYHCTSNADFRPPSSGPPYLTSPISPISPITGSEERSIVELCRTS